MGGLIVEKMVVIEVKGYPTEEDDIIGLKIILRPSNEG